MGPAGAIEHHFDRASWLGSPVDEWASGTNGWTEQLPDATNSKVGVSVAFWVGGAEVPEEEGDSAGFERDAPCEDVVFRGRRRPVRPAGSLHVFGPVAAVGRTIGARTSVTGWEVPAVRAEAIVRHNATSTILRGRTATDKGPELTDGGQAPAIAVKFQTRAVALGRPPVHHESRRGHLPGQPRARIGPCAARCYLPNTQATLALLIATAFVTASAALIVAARLAARGVTGHAFAALARLADVAHAADQPTNGVRTANKAGTVPVLRAVGPRLSADLIRAH